VSDPVRPGGSPIIASRSEGAAAASRPDNELEVESYNRYEANPVPWWVSLVWVSFFVFGVVYLVVNLVKGG